MLPVSYQYFAFRTADNVSATPLKQGMSFGAIVVCVFAFTATSRVRDRHIYLVGEYSIAGGHREVETRLRENIKVRNIQIRRHDEIFNSNDYPNYPKADLDPSVYFIDFDLEEKTCDSRITKSSVVITEKGDYSELRGVSFDFECGEYERAENYNALDQTYQARLTELFQREILTMLTLYEKSDKTPRPRP